MNSVAKVMMRRKRPMTINQIAEAANVSYSHAKNSVTSLRDMYWVPQGCSVESRRDKNGTTTYKLVEYEYSY